MVGSLNKAPARPSGGGLYHLLIFSICPTILSLWGYPRVGLSRYLVEQVP